MSLTNRDQKSAWSPHLISARSLTSAFDFVNPNREPFPELPFVSNSAKALSQADLRPKPVPPRAQESLFQEPGIRRSCALPHELHVHGRAAPKLQTLTLEFHNTGRVGAVLHAYDRLHLDRIPRRYTVEAGRTLADDWLVRFDEGRYDLWVYGPNGFVREFRGNLMSRDAHAEVRLEYAVANTGVRLIATTHGRETTLTAHANAYRDDGPWTLRASLGQPATQEWSVAASHNWYDLTVTGVEFERRFAGRMETGDASFSDPAI